MKLCTLQEERKEDEMGVENLYSPLLIALSAMLDCAKDMLKPFMMTFGRFCFSQLMG